MKTIKLIFSIAFITLLSFQSSAQCKAKFKAIRNADNSIKIINESTPGTGLTFNWLTPHLGLKSGTSTSKNPVFIPSAAGGQLKGDYKIRLNVYRSSTGCRDTIIVPVVLPDLKSSNLCPADFSDSVSGVKLYLEELCFPSRNTSYTYSISAYSSISGNYVSATGPSYKKVVTFKQKDLIGTGLLFNTGSCTDTIIRVIDMSDTNNCKADFTEVISGDTVRLTNNSTSKFHKTSYRWKFGNSIGNSNISPTYVYPKNGTYNLCLYLNDTVSNCKDTVCKRIVIGPACKADFSFLIYKDSVVFSNSSSTAGSKPTYKWKFGNGDSSSVKSPNYKYTTAGTYQVCLYIKDTTSGCLDTVCKSVTIKDCKADFSYTINKSTVKFTNLSQSKGNGQTLLWLYTRGDTSSQANPTHRFKYSGSKKVCLVLTDSAKTCRDTVCKNINIVTVNCIADFTIRKNANGTFFTFINTSVPSIPLKYHWDLDYDNMYYPIRNRNATGSFKPSGAYNICLSIQDVGATCFDTICKKIYVCPKASWKAQKNKGFEYTFYNLTQSKTSKIRYKWTFDGSSSSALKSPKYTFPGSGKYQVCLIVYDSTANCADTLCKTIDLGKNNCNTGVDFSVSVIQRYGDFTSLYSPSHKRVSYSWLVPLNNRNTFYNRKILKHKFNSDGIKVVCNIVYDSLLSCRDTACKFILVDSNRFCKANFTYTNTGKKFTFTNTSTGSNPNVTFLWKFGNGDTSNLKNPIYTYSQGGNYTVCLIRTDTLNNCVDSICKGVVIAGTSCKASFTNKVSGLQVTFTNTSTVSSKPKTANYWTFGDSKDTSSENPIHTYLLAGKYEVCLTIYDSLKNCRDTVCDSITINNSTPMCRSSFNWKVVGGSIIQFSNTSIAIGITPHYLWNFGDGKPLSWATNPKHNFASKEEYNVCLYMNDTAGFNTCADTSCVDVSFLTSMFENLATRSDINVYPNPFDNEIVVDAENLTGALGKIELFSLDGSLILNKELDGSSNLVRLNLSDLQSGIYILKIYSGNNKIVKRINKVDF